ncbi:hypothetical protein TWF103_010781 [Orbilia oligospora]|nr:hypothetical protein TWF103_010781 [Orbilia oligospora]
MQERKEGTQSSSQATKQPSSKAAGAGADEQTSRRVNKCFGGDSKRWSEAWAAALPANKPGRNWTVKGRNYDDDDDDDDDDGDYGDDGLCMIYDR